MTNFNATNVALYAAGGSGDNLIGDGYVKAVEKVWIDSFTWSAVITTSDTILIGYVPANKKIVGCEVFIPASWTPTTTTINVGPSYSTALLISGATTFTLATTKFTLNNPLGMNFVTTSSTSTVSGGTIVSYTNHAIYLSIVGANGIAPTAGTLQTIIRYT